MSKARVRKRYIVEKKISVAEFKELYYERKHSIQKIADMLHTSKSSIWRYMRRQSLGRRLTRYGLDFVSIPEPDLAYFAGLFDGEGNITATIKGGIIRVEVSIVNTDARVLECRRFFTHYRLRKNMGYGHKTKAHVMYTHNFKDLHDLLSAILPYLKLKRHRAELMIRLCESRMKRFREPPNAEELNLVIQIRALNSRKGKRR